MKMYIKAAFDPSMPEWLRIKNDNNEIARNYLTGNYSMSEAKFYDTPQPDSIMIQMLYEVYKSESNWRGEYKSSGQSVVFVPQCAYNYDNYWIRTGDKYRRLSTSAKSKIAEHVVDTIYMVAPKIQDKRNARTYVDPRYKSVWDDSRKSTTWQYKGQIPQYNSRYNPDTRKYEPESEPYAWTTQSDGYWGGSGRDKSGYIIPDPTELYEKLYKRFPDRANRKLDNARTILEEYYGKLVDARQAVFDAFDIRSGKTVDHYGNAYDNVFYYLNSAINDYGYMCKGLEKCISEDGVADSVALSNYLNGSDSSGIQHYRNNIDTNLTKLYKRLGITR